MRKYSTWGFQFFDNSIDTVLNFEFCQDITIWKMTIFDKVDYFEIEPALVCFHGEVDKFGKVLKTENKC